MDRSAKVSIIIQKIDNKDNIPELVGRIHKELASCNITYEVIFIAAHFSDNLTATINQLASNYPVSFYTGKDNARSVMSCISHSKYDNICILDKNTSDLAGFIPTMLHQITTGNADIIIANNEKNRINKFFNFTKFLHQFECDAYSGLKIFRKNIASRIFQHAGISDFNLEFLVKARGAGCKIISFYIPGSKKSFLIFNPKNFMSTLKNTFTAIKLIYTKSYIYPFHADDESALGYGFHHEGIKYIHHSDLPLTQSSFQRFSGQQIFILIAICIVLILGFAINWHTTVVIILAVLTSLYFIDLLFNLFLVYRSFIKRPEIQILREKIEAVKDEDWPVYTVFCPLYKEWKVVPQYIEAMDKLDYPKSKLQVILLLEENDYDTINQIKKLQLPTFVSYLVVPNSKPKTKPKACNYGLKFAKGEYLVVYDAEDIPDLLQLKKVVIAFKEADAKVICIQAKLNFYNPHQNLLTRLFSAEYSLWFDLVLTGLQSIHAPIPLGGTSNHFRTKDLQKLKGWDSFNVTEDADLGMRLVKNGYRTAVIQSITLEEANSDLKNWFWQRTRWIKGYIQTYFLHMRNPNHFRNTWKHPHFLTFQLVIGGKITSMFINPLMWVITICYFVYRAQVGTFIESFFPTPVLYMGLLSLLLGNFLYTYYYMIGCVKHGHDELVKYIWLVPLYWIAISLAAWVAFYQFLVKPHHWAKTKHGLHIGNKKAFSHLPVLTKPQILPLTGNTNFGFAKILNVSVCIPAYNEAKNIHHILNALIRQKSVFISINKIVVVSSGSTDNTEKIVEQYSQKYSNIHLLTQDHRGGKASAINAFLNTTSDEIVVIESADTIPAPDAIEKLCSPFLKDAKIGMTGGAPIPVNDPNTFLGFIIHSWWWFHRNIPRFGEIIAYRNIFPSTSSTTAVDEAYIQAKMIQNGYKIVHVDDAIVYNKGADTVSDLIKQRRRVMNGHARLFKNEGVKIDNMTKSSLKLLLFKYKIRSPKEFFWLFGGIAIEVYARLLGAMDYRISGKNPFVWDIAASTKDISSDPGIRMEVNQK